MPRFGSPSRSSLWLVGGLFALLILAVYPDVAFRNRNFAGRDLRGYHLPIEKSIHDAYRAGTLPLWIEEIAGGRPLLPNPNAGSLYPVRPLLALVPFPLAMRILPLLHWMLAGIGTLLWLRALRMGASASWIGAATYTLSGVSVSEAIYTNIHPGMVLLPWALVAWNWSMGRGWRSLLAPALVFGLLFLAGDVVTGALAAGACLLWALLVRGKGEAGPSVVKLLIAGSLGALLALPQIVAAALWVPHTTRAILGLKFWEAFIYSVSPLRLLELFVPYPFGPCTAMEIGRVWGTGVFQGRAAGFFTTFYCGAFAAIAFFLTRRDRGFAARYARMLLGISLAIAVPGIFLQRLLPQATFPLPIRYPEKVMVLFTFALSILAAIGWMVVRKGTFARRWMIVVLLGIAAISLAAAWKPSAVGATALAVTGGDPNKAAIAGSEISRAFAEGGILWGLTLLAVALATGSRVRAAAALAILTAIPVLANRRIAESFDSADVLSPPAMVRFVQREDPEGRYRVLGETVFRVQSPLESRYLSADPAHIDYATRNWDQYVHALWDVGTVFNQDFDHGDLSRFDSLRKLAFAAATFRDSQPFWSTYALRWGARYPEQDPIAGFAPFRTFGIQVWDENRLAEPHIRFATRWSEAVGALEAASQMPRLRVGEIVVETGRRGSGSAPEGSIRMIARTPNRLVLQTLSASDAYLFVLRGWWPFRSVSVDGNPVEPVPAQVAFTAVPIPAGRHEIVWQEQLPGGSASWVGPAVFGLVALLSLRRPRAVEGP